MKRVVMFLLITFVSCKEYGILSSLVNLSRRDLDNSTTITITVSVIATLVVASCFICFFCFYFILVSLCLFVEIMARKENIEIRESWQKKIDKQNLSNLSNPIEFIKNTKNTKNNEENFEIPIEDGCFENVIEKSNNSNSFTSIEIV